MYASNKIIVCWPFRLSSSNSLKMLLSSHLKLVPMCYWLLHFTPIGDAECYSASYFDNTYRNELKKRRQELFQRVTIIKKEILYVCKYRYIYIYTHGISSQGSHRIEKVKEQSPLILIPVIA